MTVENQDIQLVIKVLCKILSWGEGGCRGVQKAHWCTLNFWTGQGSLDLAVSGFHGIVTLVVKC